MMRRHAGWGAGLGLLALLALVSCGEQEAGPGGEDFDVAKSSKSRNLAPNPAGTDLDAQVAGNTAFALDLYEHLAAENAGNLFFSPHSISTALAMTWAGARGSTEQEMAGALHFVLPQARLHPVFNALDLALESRAQGGQGSDGKGFRLRVVSSTWVQQGFTILDTFLDVLAESYGSALFLVDFVGDTEGARETINAWVEEQTEDRIEDLLPPGAVNGLTRLVLVNAVYFNAAWAYPFQPEATANGTFFRLDGSGVTAPMMHLSQELPYVATDGCQAVELPYEGNDLSMLILVPDRGRFGEFERGLSSVRLAGIVEGLANTQVTLSMPRWTLDGVTFSIAEALAALGMPSAFTAAADFSGIDGQRDLLIQDVLHQAFVRVDEAGTEAAAATAVIVGRTSLPAASAVLDVDRPFIYLIRDRPTGVVLFVGRVVDPSGT